MARSVPLELTAVITILFQEKNKTKKNKCITDLLHYKHEGKQYII